MSFMFDTFGVVGTVLLGLALVILIATVSMHLFPPSEAQPVDESQYVKLGYVVSAHLEFEVNDSVEVRIYRHPVYSNMTTLYARVTPKSLREAPKEWDSGQPAPELG